MKKFRFNLEKILNLKNQFLKSLKNDLMRYMLELNEKEKEISSLELKIKQVDARYEEKMKEFISPVEMLAYKDYLDSLYQLKKELQLQKRIINRKIEEKKKEVLTMNIEISTLDKLKEKKLDDYNYEFQKSEELLIEEFVSASASFEKSSNDIS